MAYVCSILLGYLVGTINPSYIIGKIKGVDIRRQGSGNAGASNALIVFGKLLGVLCAIFDILKAALIIWGCQALFPHAPYIYSVTGVATILGHIFPFYMKGKGGKGLACLGGVLLAYDWRMLAIFLAVEIVLALLVDYICIVPLTASVAYPVVYGLITHDLWGSLILCTATLVMWWKHIENLKRIKNGTEMRLSFLWRGDKEVERLKENQKKNQK